LVKSFQLAYLFFRQRWYLDALHTTILPFNIYVFVLRLLNIHSSVARTQHHRETLKQVEDRKSVIIWLVERHNCHTHATLNFDRQVLVAWPFDLMENIESRLIPGLG
jgi:hypothetical protein